MRFGEARCPRELPPPRGNSELRAAQPEGTTDTIKMVFAEHQNEAERLLLTPREAPVEGDD